MSSINCTRCGKRVWDKYDGMLGNSKCISFKDKDEPMKWKSIAQLNICGFCGYLFSEEN